MKKREDAVDPEAVKIRSTEGVIRLAGKAIEWLPIIEPPKARTGEELAQRTMILNALEGYTMQDLYYRAHWYVATVRSAAFTRQSSASTRS